MANSCVGVQKINRSYQKIITFYSPTQLFAVPLDPPLPYVECPPLTASDLMLILILGEQSFLKKKKSITQPSFNKHLIFIL